MQYISNRKPLAFKKELCFNVRTFLYLSNKLTFQKYFSLLRWIIL